MTEAYRRRGDVEVHPETLLPLLNLQPESDLQREIRDIVGELEIIKYITRQQKKVVSKYVTKAREILTRQVDDSPKDRLEDAIVRSIEAAAKRLASGAFSDSEPAILRVLDDSNGKKSNSDAKHKVFEKRAAQLESDIQALMEELDELSRAADRAAESVGLPVHGIRH